MTLESILIFRDVPIINRRVAKPPNIPGRYNVVTDFESVLRLSLGSGSSTGSDFGAQEWVRLGGIRPDEWYLSDPMDLL